MNSNLIGAIYNVQPEEIETGESTAVNEADYWKNFWIDIFSKNPGIAKRLNSKPIEYWLGILYSPRLTSVQKFEQILGVKVSALNSGKLLGDVFEWISNLFSNENLAKFEKGLRQGSDISSNFANALNVIRNKSVANSNDNMSVNDAISQGYFQAEDFYSKYGKLMLIGAAGLIAILLIKK